MNNPKVTPPKIAKTLSRHLSLLHITMMGVGMMVGAGVFLGIGNTLPLGLDISIFQPKYIASTSLLKTLLREAEHHDLIVMGASQEKLFQRIVMGRLPEEFTRRWQNPPGYGQGSIPLRAY